MLLLDYKYMLYSFCPKVYVHKIHAEGCWSLRVKFPASYSPDCFPNSSYISCHGTCKRILTMIPSQCQKYCVIGTYLRAILILQQSFEGNLFANIICMMMSWRTGSISSFIGFLLLEIALVDYVGLKQKNQR